MVEETTNVVNGKEYYYGYYKGTFNQRDRYGELKIDGGTLGNVSKDELCEINDKNTEIYEHIKDISDKLHRITFIDHANTHSYLMWKAKIAMKSEDHHLVLEETTRFYGKIKCVIDETIIHGVKIFR